VLYLWLLPLHRLTTTLLPDLTQSLLTVSTDSVTPLVWGVQSVASTI